MATAGDLVSAWRGTPGHTAWWVQGGVEGVLDNAFGGKQPLGKEEMEWLGAAFSALAKLQTRTPEELHEVFIALKEKAPPRAMLRRRWPGERMFPSFDDGFDRVREEIEF